MLQELLDEPALALVGHRLADDLAGGEQGEVGDLGADLRDRAGLLGLDLGGRAVAQALELLAGRGDVRVARLLGDLLGAGQDLVRLAASLGERGDALLFRVLAVAPGLFGVLEALLDPVLRSASIAETGLNANDQMMTKNRMKLSALTITQNRLIWNSAALSLSVASGRGVAARRRWRRPGCPPATRPAG